MEIIMYTDHYLFIIMHIVFINYLSYRTWMPYCCCSVLWLSILILVLVHECKIAPELKTTVPRFQTFLGDMPPDSPTLCGSVNILTSFEPAATALLDKIVCAACVSINMCDSVVYTSCFLVLSLRQSGQYQMNMVCLDVSILSETTGKCNMGDMSHAPFLPRLVLGNNIIQYGLHTISSMSPSSNSCCESCSESDNWGAGGEHEKNIPTNSGKEALLKSSLTCSTSSIQKSLADFGTQLPKCGSTNERMAG